MERTAAEDLLAVCGRLDPTKFRQQLKTHYFAVAFNVL